MSSKKSKKFTDSEGIIWDSKDESTMNKWLIEAGYSDFETQYRFIPSRRFRTDFAFPKEKIAVEVMGMDIWGCAGHNNVFTIANDYKRHMIALQHGWKMVYWCKGVTKTDLFNCLSQLMTDHYFELESKD